VIKLIRPTAKDQNETFQAKFVGMTMLSFDYDNPIATVERLVQAIRSDPTGHDRSFLLPLEADDPAGPFGSLMWKTLS
jgi:hypothetical protein